MRQTARLKAGSGGWFAAGEGFERALRALSDAAFKVFGYICLRAERASGCLEYERGALARELGKSRSTLGRCLRELEAKGICELQAAPNQHRRARLRVRAQYWPYETRAEPAGQGPDPETPGPDRRAYVAAVRRMFREPACVQGRFGLADERLAADWHGAGVSLETVRRAILLGSVRKSISLLDRPDGEPVRSLRYFASLLEEVRTESFPDSYWQHVEFNLRHCERLGPDRHAEAAGSACSNLAPAGPPTAVWDPSSTAGEARKETG